MKNLSVRLEDDMLHKLHIMSDYNGRSATKQAAILIRNAIKKFEEIHGEINLGYKKYEESFNALNDEQKISIENILKNIIKQQNG